MNRSSKRELLEFLDSPGARNALRLPPNIGKKEIGGDGLNDDKKSSQSRVDAVTKACVDALK